MNKRIEQLRKGLRRSRLEGFLVKNPSNLFYLTGFCCEGCWGLITLREAVIFVPQLAYHQAKGDVYRGIRVSVFVDSIYSEICDYLKRYRIKKLGIESSLSVTDYLNLTKQIRNLKLELEERVIQNLRIVKDKKEQELIEKACRIANKVFRYTKGIVKPGMREVDVANSVACYMKRHFGVDPAFDIIVASGPNTAYPHHKPGNRMIEKNDIVLLDIGAKYRGYSSDLTRVWILGRIEKILKRNIKKKLNLNKLLIELRRIQKSAVASVKPGIQCAHLDDVCRSYFRQLGLDNNYIHNTGHGVGIDVHESPYLSPKSQIGLKKGMVITVEPGIYFEGLFGLRWEDTVLVTDRGCRVLTQ